MIFSKRDLSMSLLILSVFLRTYARACENLVEKRVDRIFAPLMIRVPQENPTAEGNHTCALLQVIPWLLIEQRGFLPLRCLF